MHYHVIKVVVVSFTTIFLIFFNCHSLWFSFSTDLTYCRPVASLACFVIFFLILWIFGEVFFVVSAQFVSPLLSGYYSLCICFYTDEQLNLRSFSTICLLNLPFPYNPLSFLFHLSNSPAQWYFKGNTFSLCVIFIYHLLFVPPVHLHFYSLQALDFFLATLSTPYLYLSSFSSYWCTVPI